MKVALVQEIFAELESKGLTPKMGGGSDITVECELLDAKMGSGEKKISYGSAILVKL